jgi:hypothetical protein
MQEQARRMVGGRRLMKRGKGTRGVDEDCDEVVAVL